MSLTLLTNYGPLKLELYCERVPLHCKNFLALCASGKYDGCKFHRNIKSFIIQGGDYEFGNGKGGKAIVSLEDGKKKDSSDSGSSGEEGPGNEAQKKEGEDGNSNTDNIKQTKSEDPAKPKDDSKPPAEEDGLIPHHLLPDLKHERRGTLSMADVGKSGKVGSQFFITYKNRLTELDDRYTVIGRLLDGFDTLNKLEELPIVDEKKWRPKDEILIERVVIHSNPVAEMEVD